MSKRKKFKKATYTATRNVSDIIKKLELTEQDINELNNYFSEDIKGNTEDSISKIYSDQNLTKNKIIFLSYLRGILDVQSPSENRYINMSDAINKIGEGFNGWNIEDMLDKIVPIFSTLIMTCISDPEELSIFLKHVSGYFEKFSEDIKNNDPKVIKMIEDIHRYRPD